MIRAAEGGSAAAAAFQQGQVIGAGQEVGPSVGATQALDGGELGLGITLNGERAFKKIGISFARPSRKGVSYRKTDKPSCLGRIPDMCRILIACSLFLILPLSAFADDFQRGYEAFKKGDYDSAILHFSAYIREHPKEAGIYIYRGLAYFDKKEYDKAIKDYSEAIRLDPKNPAFYVNRGVAHRLKKEYDKAIKDYSEAIRLNPKCAEAYNSRGAAYWYKKEYDKAIQDISETVRLKPKDARACNTFAWLLATCPKDSVRDGRKALELATKACELSEWKATAYLGTLAAAHAETKNFKEAVKWQKKALTLEYDTAEAKEKARRRLELYEAHKPYRDD